MASRMPLTFNRLNIVRFEKILRREDGSRVKVIIIWSSSSNRDYPRYHVIVERCAKRKRTWLDVTYEDYRFSLLSREDKHRKRREDILKAVTEDEILQVKLELWETLKPT